MRRIRFKDKISAIEHSNLGGLRGEVIFGKGKHKVPFIDPYGNKSYRTEFDEILYEDENIVPIGAYQFAFDKLFNIGLDQETTLRVGDLNDEAPMMKIGVQRAAYKSPKYTMETTLDGAANTPPNLGVNISALNFVFGFMVGDGASREDNITVIAPNYKDRTLFHAIPFRMDNDGFPLPNGKYFGKFKTAPNSAGDTITSYYIKKFDNPAPRIIHSYVTNNPNELEIVDDSVFSSTTSIPIESYVEINLSINESDCRGYFTTTDTITRINEFGLVTGWYNGEEDDYESIRLFTKFTRPSITLFEEDSVEAIYRLYAR